MREKKKENPSSIEEEKDDDEVGLGIVIPGNFQIMKLSYVVY
jgi:hypothetical protein